MDIWNWLQENSGVLALLVPLAGMLYAGFARMYKALDAVAERRHKRLEERQKEVAKSVDDMKGDIRAIWHPALGAFFGQKNGQRSDNHPDVTSRS